MKRKIGFVTADVFTTSAFGGNPVAVIPDAGGLNGDVMQKIAGEFNLSETTFVLPPKDPAHTAEVRVFTPRAEIPFAGHPNIGTAFVLATLGKCHGRPVSDRLVFEELAGLVEVELAKDCEGVVGAILRAPQTFQRGETVTAESVASACSLDPGDIEVGNHEPCIASTGMPFVFAELKSRGALASANPRPDVFAEHFATDMTSGIQLYVPSETERVDLETWVFAPLHGVYEDPATGSANVTLVGFLADLEGGFPFSLGNFIKVAILDQVFSGVLAGWQEGNLESVWLIGVRALIPFPLSVIEECRLGRSTRPLGMPGNAEFPWEVRSLRFSSK